MEKQDLSLVLKPGDKVYIKTAYAGYIVREVESIKRGIITLTCKTRFDRYGKQKDVPKWTRAERLFLYNEGHKLTIQSKISKLLDEKTTILKRVKFINSDLAKLETELNSIEDNQ